MLKTLAIRNYRLLGDVCIEFESGCPVVLIGPNGSGKSTFLEVLDLLATAASDKLSVALLRDRGGFGSVHKAGCTDVTEVTVEIVERESVLRYRVQLQARPSWYQVVGEHLDEVAGPATRTWLTRLQPTEATLGRYEQSNADRVTVLEHELALTEVRQDALYPALGRMRTALASIGVYPGFYTAPRWARDARESGVSMRDSAVVSRVQRLDRRGFDLTNALYHLKTDHEATWAELEHHFRAEFPQITRLEFPADPAGGKLALAYRDSRFADARFSAQQMSDGMLAFLAFLAATLTPDPALAIGFDEPESYLHPSALRRLVGIVEEASRSRPVILTTHSDRLLDFLSDPANSIRVCESGPDGVQLRELDASALSAWRKEYDLGQLRSFGHLDSTNATYSEP